MVTCHTHGLKFNTPKGFIATDPDVALLNTCLRRWGIVYPNLDGRVEMFRKNKDHAEEVSEFVQTLFSQAMTVEQVLDEVDQNSRFYRESGGGMTLSGGECHCNQTLAWPHRPICQKVTLNLASFSISGFGRRQAPLKPAPFAGTLRARIKLALLQFKHPANEFAAIHAKSADADFS